MISDELVPVFTTNHAAEAEIFKNALDAEGIQCAIEGENQAGLSGIIEIRGLVHAADEARAREILFSHSQALPEDVEPAEETA